VDTLTGEQGARLAAVLAELVSNPTVDLINLSAALRMPDVVDEPTKRRAEAAFAGVIAAEKIKFYLEALRASNARRLELGNRIKKLNAQARDLEFSDPLASIAPEIQSTYLAGQQEVELHVFAVCIRVIFKLLPYVARTAGYKIPAADRETLKTFEPLRHYYEHLWEQLPGGGGTYVKEVANETGDGRIVFGLPMDDQGRVVLAGKTIDVSTDGVNAVHGVVERTWDNLRESSLEEAEKHLRRNPDTIPDPERLRSDLRIRLGGALEGLAPFRPYDQDPSAWVLVEGVWRPPPADS
jgi:hypothetical protein